MRPLLLSLLLVSFSPSNHADSYVADLSTPRRAAESLIRHAMPDGGAFDLEKAAECLDTSKLPGSPAEQQVRGQSLAKMFADALEQLDVTIAVEGLPDTAQPEQTLIALHPSLPGLYLTRTAKGWQVAGSSLKSIERLHRRAFGRFTPAILQHLPHWLTVAPFGIALWQVLGVVVSVVAGLLLRRAVLWLIGSRVRRLASDGNVPALGDAVESAARPLGLLAASLTLRIALPELQFGWMTSYALTLLTAVSTFAVVWLTYRQIDVLGRFLQTLTSKTESRLDDQLVPLTRKALKVLAVALGAIFLLHNLGVQVTSLIAGLGIGGLAVALAAQETLSNFFASLVILADRPFQVGDLVSVGEITGTVEQVGLRSTRIRTADRSLVTVPNSKLASTNIRNLGERYERQVVIRLGLTYDTSPAQLDACVSEIQRVLTTHPRVKSADQIVRLDTLTASSAELLVEFYVEATNREQELLTRHEVLRNFLTLPERIGIRFAYPTQTIYIAK
ncbi:MAG: mechanosensitive ion channel family protein [Acidobacteriota bacterium]